MPFESWTGVLQIQPCVEIIENLIFGERKFTPLGEGGSGRLAPATEAT